MTRRVDNFVNLPIPSKEDAHFDLSVLLKQDNLDIREASTINPSLTVGAYRELLQQFIDLAPDICDIIKKFARQDFNLTKRDYKNLEQMLHLFECIKCDKFAVDFHFLKNACRKKENWELAANHAEQIIDGFNGFYKKINNAKKLDATNARQNENLPLKEYVDELDKNDINRKRIILAVDDSPDILKAIYTVTKDKYKVFLLSNPTHLENALKQVKPDLFLLDYRMPEINGFDLIPIIRGYSEHKDTPVIYLTSAGTIDHKSAAVMLGACDYLVKPLKADALRETIALHINNSSL